MERIHAVSFDAVIQVGIMMNSTFGEIFAQSTDAVFGIDADGRIRYSNGNFERLMGYSRKQLSGTWCAEVLCGVDVHGQPFCGHQCPIPKAVSGKPSLGDFDLVVKGAKGDQVLVNIGASYIPQQMREEAGQVNVYFSMRQVTPQRLLQRMSMASAKSNSKHGLCGHGRLTSREKEILGLAAKGMKTAQIASRLNVSSLTVRTHFKNIYPKLGVNSRTEAVIVTLQHGLR